jgi:hypothetical protein
LFDSDPEVCDLPRVMRPPVTWHQKGEPFQSRIHALNPEIEKTEAEFQAALAKARGQRPAAAARSPFAQNHAPILPAVQGGLNEKYDKDPPSVTSDNVAWVREMLAAIPVASFTELVKQLNGGSKKTERDYWLDIGRALHWWTAATIPGARSMLNSPGDTAMNSMRAASTRERASTLKGARSQSLSAP